ncbi:MAG: glycosyltransferase family 39 protein [Desulfuromonadales bacterium]|nr:glycosyltransferase family 39 protein [Desulfuromonadales bacterium]
MSMGTRKFFERKGYLLDISLLTLIFGVVFFESLGRLPLLGTDEARYLEIPREMIERGDFITPTLNYVPYFEKPPLHYWFNALATLLFGETAFSARFFGALWGVLGVLLTYLLGRRLFDRQKGRLSAIVLGTSLGFVVQARVNITDTTLSFFLCAALGSFLIASRPDQSRKSLYYTLFYLCAALAVLAKGLIGIVLPAVIILAFLRLTRRWYLLHEMRLPLGIPLFLLVCVPWFMLVSLRNPGFFDFFFIHEHFQRFFTKVHHRYQPPWFFFPVLLGGMLPWTFFIPAAILRSWRGREESAGEARLFLLLSGGIIFAFFSLSQSKLIPYILPVYPVCAILVGVYLGELIEEKRGAPTTVLAISLCYAICALGLTAYPWLARHPRLDQTGSACVGALFLIHGIIAFMNTRSPHLHRLVLGLALASYFTAMLAPPVFMAGIAKKKLIRDLALKVRDLAGNDAVVVSFGYQQELPLYTRRRVLVVGSPGELEFGSKSAPWWFIEEKRFDELWSGNRPVFALVPKDSVGDLPLRLTPSPNLLGAEGPCALIANR